MMGKALYFTGVRQVEIREEALGDRPPDSSHMKTLYSLISTGTEMLVYRGELSPELPLDDLLPTLSGSFSYPLKYGYSAIGEIISDDDSGNSTKKTARSFAFNPHEDQFFNSEKKYLLVPEHCDSKDAIFMANMESAINVVGRGHSHGGESCCFGPGCTRIINQRTLA